MKNYILFFKKSVFMTGFFIANFGKCEPYNNYAGYFFFEPLKTYFLFIYIKQENIIYKYIILD